MPEAYSDMTDREHDTNLDPTHLPKVKTLPTCSNNTKWPGISHMHSGGMQSSLHASLVKEDSVRGEAKAATFTQAVTYKPTPSGFQM